ncbi:hypothetical protein GCM10025794_15710 [Massilia kyonggiensis]
MSRSGGAATLGTGGSGVLSCGSDRGGGGGGGGSTVSGGTVASRKTICGVCKRMTRSPDTKANSASA